MKKLMISLLVFIPLQIVSGQDKIVNIQHDTIYCKIISVSSTDIKYQQKGKNQYTVVKKIPTEEVLEYFQNLELSKSHSNYRTDSQILKPVKKHYLGFNFTNGLDMGDSWDGDYVGGGFMYASRRDDSEIGVGLFISNTISISLPITAKKYLGKYVFIGFGVIPGYEDGLCVGASVMLGVEVVSEGGFSFSLAPNLQYTLINLMGKEAKVNSSFGSYTQMKGTEILQYMGISSGIGYRF